MHPFQLGGGGRLKISEKIFARGGVGSEILTLVVVDGGGTRNLEVKIKTA